MRKATEGVGRQRKKFRKLAVENGAFSGTDNFKIVKEDVEVSGTPKKVNPGFVKPGQNVIFNRRGDPCW